ncbi:Glucoside xylosyltransferase 2 [Porphyridium purpureum]|uniref:UDP-D-xylose:beta-D-glucoside alpha-1,3-D-xylosyltransferase n=1 Tax=Porphyridium purpureum TaxID=35688 RepID=A0A5J4Z3R6_PORPP|nr:Glucoside xylosyltransferase 2 [Porphyridium purpureum]|eukprot:POR5778..scf295_1
MAVRSRVKVPLPAAKAAERAYDEMEAGETTPAHGRQLGNGLDDDDDHDRARVLLKEGAAGAGSRSAGVVAGGGMMKASTVACSIVLLLWMVMLWVFAWNSTVVPESRFSGDWLRKSWRKFGLGDSEQSQSDGGMGWANLPEERQVPAPSEQARINLVQESQAHAPVTHSETPTEAEKQALETASVAALQITSPGVATATATPSPIPLCEKAPRLSAPVEWKLGQKKVVNQASMRGISAIVNSGSPVVRVLYTVCNVKESFRDVLFTSLKSMVLFSDRRRKHEVFIVTTANDTDVVESVTRNVQAVSRASNFEFLVVPTNASRPSDNYYAPCAGVRLFVYKDLPSVDKIIYLDTDTLILQPISELFDTFKSYSEEQMFGFADEAVGPGNSSLDFMWFNRTSQTRGRAPFPRFNEKGLNSGVIMMDFEKIRKSEYGMRMEGIIEKWVYGLDIYFADQDYLNIFCGTYAERCRTIPCNWNFRVRSMFTFCTAECKNGLAIVHGTQGMMPVADIYEDLLPALERLKYDHTERGGWLVFTRDTLKVIYNSVRLCDFDNCPNIISGNVQKVTDGLYNFYCNPFTWHLPGDLNETYAQSRDRCQFPSGAFNILLEQNTCFIPAMMCRIIGNMWKHKLLVAA